MYSSETIRDIQRARDAFERGCTMDPAWLRPEVLASWERSRSYGLNFGVSAKTVLTADALAARVHERSAFLDIASPIIDSLYDFTSGSGFLSTLSDEDGYVLKVFGDADIAAQAARRNGMMAGSSRHEREVGTNGIGTALVIRRPLQLVAGEHYYPLDPRWVCSAAPIFRPDGEVAGVFCLSGLLNRVASHTLGLAAAAATAISQQLRMKQAYDAAERLQKRLSIIVETMNSGILLLDRERRVTQSNSRALRLLNRREEDVQGLTLEELFTSDGPDFSGLAGGAEAVTVFPRRGSRRMSFALTAQPASTEEMVVTFEKTEALHRKVNRIIGSDAYFTFDDILGRSPVLANATALARVVAENTSNVLLSGESGTGKELFAQAIHNASVRRDGPFMAINCGALPKSLIESELFGYESGTFTGARTGGRAGKFELAHGGTIFLDEIGDMPFDVQAALLRVLQSREVYRLGSGTPVKIDVRVIAASNKNLMAAMEANTFRSDLYYRLNVFNIHIPPLRERRDDIRFLARHFLRRYAADAGKPITDFSAEALHLLEAQPWPGNVRELENVVERAVYLADSDPVGPDCLQSLVACRHDSHPVPVATAGDDAFRPFAAPFQPDAQRKALEQALLATGGNVRRAACLLGLSRRTLYRKMSAWGIDHAGIRRQARPS